MLERSIEEYLVDEVEKRGGLCPKTVWPGRRGCPDREAYWPGGHIDKIETKRPVGGRYEPGQRLAHKTLALRGTPVYLLNTREKVDQYIAQRSRKDFGQYAHLPMLFSVPVSLE